MNVRLMLLSKIGAQYDPVTGAGTVGRNYCYQTSSAARMFFEGKHFNPFIGAGTLGQSMDDFNGDAFDHSKLDFVGGAGINCVVSATAGRSAAVPPCPAARAGAPSGNRRRWMATRIPWASPHKGRPIRCGRITWTSIPPIATGMAGPCCA